MECNDYLQLISLYLDNSLDRDSEQKLFEHLEHCEHCKKEFDDITAMLNLLKEEPLIDLPNGYHDELMNKIKESKVVLLHQKKPKAKPWKKYTAIAASFLVLFVVGGGVLGSGVLGTNNEKTSDGMKYGNIADKNAMSGEVHASASMAVPEQSVDNSTANAANGATNEMAVVKMDTATGANANGENPKTLGKSNDGIVLTERKIIKDYYLSMEVKNFDEFIEQAKALADSSGGYVENCYSGIYYTDNAKNIKLKEGNIVIRIPQEICSTVINTASQFGDVISENESSRDITSEYVDTSGRLSAKRLEEARLLEILGKCETVEDILKVEEQLGYIRADIESYTTMINNWDKLVGYSSVSINAKEVGNTSIDTISDDFGSRIKDGFIQSINICIEGMQDIVLFGAKISIPLITIIIVIIVVFLIFRHKKNKKIKKAIEEAKEDE